MINKIQWIFDFRIDSYRGYLHNAHVATIEHDFCDDLYTIYFMNKKIKNYKKLYYAEQRAEKLLNEFLKYANLQHKHIK